MLRPHRAKYAIPGLTLNQTFFLVMKASGLAQCQLEFQFHQGRKWRFDFAWTENKVAVEIEGGVFIARGGHTTGMAYTRNCEKYNQAALDGWLLLRFTNKMLEDNSGYVIDTIKAALLQRKSS